ncbi:MAG: hypothetical protein C0502_04015 [Opitutus sp.]|nr:hypothetical protein [Opitutus sp.]
MLRFVLALFLSGAALAAENGLSRVHVPPMKTAIYIGSVTLGTGEFRREGERFTATYEAKVFPWFFWSETGRITITVAAADWERLARGETIEFTGDALNHRNKPRKVAGRALPGDALSGRIKVRIHVDDVELIFNGPYRLAP